MAIHTTSLHHFYNHSSFTWVFFSVWLDKMEYFFTFIYAELLLAGHLEAFPHTLKHMFMIRYDTTSLVNQSGSAELEAIECNFVYSYKLHSLRCRYVVLVVMHLRVLAY